MPTIKKAFQPLIEFLEANKDKKVGTILDQAIEFTSAKIGGGRSASTVLRNEAGDVTHVFCYYHKQWEDVTVAEYGAKASSMTGLSNMCKEGTAAWSKQQRDAKSAKEAILAAVTSGDLEPGDIPAELEEVEALRNKVNPRADGHGTKEAPAA